jgi:hypothetical protein
MRQPFSLSLADFREFRTFIVSLSKIKIAADGSAAGAKIGCRKAPVNRQAVIGSRKTDEYQPRFFIQTNRSPENHFTPRKTTNIKPTQANDILTMRLRRLARFIVSCFRRCLRRSSMRCSRPSSSSLSCRLS